MIIGISGTLGAGKGAVVEFLLRKNFKHYSVRAFLTEEILKRGLEVSRNSMVVVGNDLREKFGVSYIVEELYKRALVDGGNCVIEGIRYPEEVEALKKKKDFVLFAVDADVEARYSRIIERASAMDKISFDEFVMNEQREMGSSDSTKQNLRKCIGMADYKFKNDWTIDELYRKVGAVLEKIGFGDERHVRPDWDEYFMEICKLVAKRSTCDISESGCVVVKDNQILASGYVGSPVGFPHCDKAGHKIEGGLQDSSVRQNCLRVVHAEQNVICQAAKRGVSIDGATIYCKRAPCYACAKMIINSGIKRVVCESKHFDGEKSEKMFKMAGIKFDILDKSV